MTMTTNKLQIAHLYEIAEIAVRRFPERNLPSGLTQDELVQVAVVKVWEIGDKAPDGAANLDGWIYKAMRYAMLSFIGDWKWGGNHRVDSVKYPNGNYSLYNIEGMTTAAEDGSQYGFDLPIEDDTTDADLDSRMSDLTDKQREVIDLLREGYRQTDVARILDLAQPTVREYARMAGRKMGLGDD